MNYVAQALQCVNPIPATASLAEANSSRLGLTSTERATRMLGRIGLFENIRCRLRRTHAAAPPLQEQRITPSVQTKPRSTLEDIERGKANGF